MCVCVCVCGGGGSKTFLTPIWGEVFQNKISGEAGGLPNIVLSTLAQ